MDLNKVFPYNVPVHCRVSINVLLLVVCSLSEQEGGDRDIVVIGCPHQQSHASVISHIEIKV